MKPSTQSLGDWHQVDALCDLVFYDYACALMASTCRRYQCDSDNEFDQRLLEALCEALETPIGLVSVSPPAATKHVVSRSHGVAIGKKHFQSQLLSHAIEAQSTGDVHATYFEDAASDGLCELGVTTAIVVAYRADDHVRSVMLCNRNGYAYEQQDVGKQRYRGRDGTFARLVLSLHPL